MPLLVVVLLTKFEGRLILGMRKEIVGAAIFGVASLTDVLDGYLARRRKQMTTLGQLMDPLADKLLITAALVSLVQMDLAPAWMVAVILGREFAVTLLRGIAGSKRPGDPRVAARQVQDAVGGGGGAGADPLARLDPAAVRLLGTIALWLALVTRHRQRRRLLPPLRPRRRPLIRTDGARRASLRPLWPWPPGFP